MSRIDDLVAELRREREAFLRVLASVDLELVTVPGVVDDWSVRDLTVHVAFWAEHAVRALELAGDGRGDEFAYDTGQTDAMNARLLEEARRTTPEAALEREELAFDALVAAVESLNPELLDLQLGNGDRVAEVIAYDGADHYREHTQQLGAWFGTDDDDD